MLTPDIITFDVPDARETGTTHLISCAQWGVAGRKPTLLCVHGLTRTGRDFDFLASALAQDFHILAPDMRGRGKSQWLVDASGYSNAAYLSDIAFILQSLGITQLHWLGTSMGGILGLMAANTSPGLIRSLILNDIGCLIPASGLQRIKDIAFMQTVFATRSEAETALQQRTASFGITEAAHWRHVYQYGLESVDTGWRFTYDPALFTAGFAPDAPITDINLWPLWPAITAIPVLLLRGAESDILSHATAMEMKEKHPHLTLAEFDAVGHAPALMNDKQIALIQRWMSAMV